MSTLRSKTGLLNHPDGRVARARFYYGTDEDAPPDRAKIDPEQHATWIEDDGAVGIRRGTSISIGATRAYSANYETVDWEN